MIKITPENEDYLLEKLKIVTYISYYAFTNNYYEKLGRIS